MLNPFHLPLADAGENLQRVLADVARRIGGAGEIFDVRLFTQLENPEETGETAAMVDSANNVVRECIKDPDWLRDAFVTGVFPSDLGAQLQKLAVFDHAAADAFAFLAHQRRRAFVVLVTACYRTFVYWNWRYAYRVADILDLDVECLVDGLLGPAEDLWFGDCRDRELVPPERAAARYGYLVDEFAEDLALSRVTEPGAAHDPYGLLRLASTPEALHHALMLAHDRMAARAWLKQGTCPDVVLRGGVHPGRRFLEAVGSSADGRWVSLRGSSEVFGESDVAELSDVLHPAPLVSRHGTIRVYHLKMSGRSDSVAGHLDRYRKGTYHLVFSFESDGTRRARVFEMSGTAGALELPQALLKTQVPVARAACAVFIDLLD